MKKVILLISTFLMAGILFFLLHSSPERALRTKVFLLGYPKAALTSEIVDYTYLNINFDEKNHSGYAFTAPPIETATQGVLDTYLVKKTGILYFAEYRKDI